MMTEAMGIPVGSWLALIVATAAIIAFLELRFREERAMLVDDETEVELALELDDATQAVLDAMAIGETERVAEALAHLVTATTATADAYGIDLKAQTRQAHDGRD